MFDLNAICVDSLCDETEAMATAENVSQGSGRTPMDDSGTSVSSIVSADEACNSGGGEEDSNSNSNSNVSSSAAFTFEILKKSPEIVTKQLLPVNGGSGSGVVWEFSSGSSLGSVAATGRPQWLNLGLADSGGGSEVRAVQQKSQPVRKSRRGPRSRSSQYRGVTFYRRTGRWESHIWDCGKQVYLGGFDTAQAAARAYDRAAIKFRGVDADINFSTSDYDEDMKQTKDLSKEEFVHILRRQSTGFARGSSKYRGVTLHKSGRWEARMGQLLGKKAYDKAAIQCIGKEAVTNFEPNAYQGEVLLESNNRGNTDNLDLSLGISPPSQKRNDIAGHYHFPCADCTMFCGNRLPVDSSASAAAVVEASPGLVMASRHPSTFSGVYQNFLPYDKETAKEEKIEAVPLPRFPNWAWQMHGYGTMNMTPRSLFSTAASSGFSSSHIAHSTATFPQLNSQNRTVQGIYPPK